MITGETFKQGFRKLAAGVSCITTRWNDQPYGFVATSVSSLCGEPPSLIVCVNRSVSSHDQISQSGILCVNVLRRGDHPVATLFGDKNLRAIRFTQRSWTSLTTGAPVLPEALVAFDCRVENEIVHGTHTVFFAGIVDAMIRASTAEKPLLFFDGSYRELGEAVC